MLKLLDSNFRWKRTINRDMSASKVSDLRKIELLKNEIENKEKNLKAYQEYINRKDDEVIWVLEAQKFKKEVELKKCYLIQFWAKSILSNDILTLQRRIDELKSLEKRENELKELKKELSGIPKRAERALRGYPESLDSKTVSELRQYFTSLPPRLTPKVPFINIIMVGGTGTGKSTFLETFTTALSNRKTKSDIYRACPSQGREYSATKKIHLEPIYIGNSGQKLPCRFFDMPGIPEKDIIKKDELNKIFNGEIELNDDMHQETDMKLDTQYPNPAKVVHCILYVLRATTNLDNMQPNVQSMVKYLKSKNTEDGVRQFVVVTYIDKLGVPDSDMENAYKYQSVHNYCDKVSVAFGVDLLHVIPVSNNFEDVTPSDAKNAMSLHGLLRVFESTKEYIERRWLKEETIMISKEWSGKKNNV